jgi:hypothetical protein
MIVHDRMPLIGYPTLTKNMNWQYYFKLKHTVYAKNIDGTPLWMVLGTHGRVAVNKLFDTEAEAAGWAESEAKKLDEKFEDEVLT